MPSWNSKQYLKFERERTQPAIDLAARCEIDSPRYIVDLGCGPGNSTAIVARRWPAARVTGLDRSSDMLAEAHRRLPQVQWLEADIAQWTAAPNDRPDVLFSNAALQWLEDHPSLLPRLLRQVASGGALAVQLPANSMAPPHKLVRDMAASPPWAGYFTQTPRTWDVHSREDYYDMLAPGAAHIDIWETTYLHVLPDVEHIVEWYKGTGLRPWLEALPDEQARSSFLEAYLSGLRPYYRPKADGRVLFPFHRLFFIVYR